MNKRYPISILNLTLYSWGLDFKTPLGWLVWSRIGGGRAGRCYLSPNGTPSQATRFFWGRVK